MLVDSINGAQDIVHLLIILLISLCQFGATSGTANEFVAQRRLTADFAVFNCLATLG